MTSRPGKLAAALIAAAVIAGSLGLAIAAVSQQPLSWTRIAAPTFADLKSLSVVDATTAYAVGSGGTVLSTRDGGATWEAFPTETTATLNGVDAPAVGAVWAVGDGGTIVTENEIGAWVSETSNVATDLMAVDFVDRTTGWAVGAGATIIHTLDSGTTWTTPIVFYQAQDGPQGGLPGPLAVRRLKAAGNRGGILDRSKAAAKPAGHAQGKN
jgi:photosystem II stability/assembly factor-like uncharacterized protein